MEYIIKYKIISDKYDHGNRKLPKNLSILNAIDKTKNECKIIIEYTKEISILPILF